MFKRILILLHLAILSMSKDFLVETYDDNVDSREPFSDEHPMNLTKEEFLAERPASDDYSAEHPEGKEHPQNAS